MDPKLVLKMIKACARKASTEKPTSMAHLVELEDLISILRDGLIMVDMFLMTW